MVTLKDGRFCSLREKLRRRSMGTPAKPIPSLYKAHTPSKANSPSKASGSNMATPLGKTFTSKGATPVRLDSAAKTPVKPKKSEFAQQTPVARKGFFATEILDLEAVYDVRSKRTFGQFNVRLSNTKKAWIPKGSLVYQDKEALCACINKLQLKLCAAQEELERIERDKPRLPGSPIPKTKGSSKVPKAKASRKAKVSGKGKKTPRTKHYPMDSKEEESEEGQTESEVEESSEDSEEFSFDELPFDEEEVVDGTGTEGEAEFSSEFSDDLEEDAESDNSNKDKLLRKALRNLPSKNALKLKQMLSTQESSSEDESEEDSEGSEESDEASEEDEEESEVSEFDTLHLDEKPAILKRNNEKERVPPPPTQQQQKAMPAPEECIEDLFMTQANSVPYHPAVVPNAAPAKLEKPMAEELPVRIEEVKAPAKRAAYPTPMDKKEAKKHRIAAQLSAARAEADTTTNNGCTVM